MHYRFIFLPGIDTEMEKIVILLLLVFALCALCSEVEQAKYIKRGKLKPRPGGLKNSRSVQMTFPNSHFGADIDWRAAGVHDTQMRQLSDAKKSWKDVSWSQHDEDMWLMNNWFYGVKEGVIIESGALDGILFSNSNLFESFLNWTAILVGELIYFWIPVLFIDVFSVCVVLQRLIQKTTDISV